MRLPGPSRIERAKRDHPEYFWRNIGWTALFCLAAALVFWFLIPRDELHSFFRRHQPATSFPKDHESVPMPAGTPDRG